MARIFTKYMIKVGAKMANKWLFRGEMTEELHEYFTAIKENLVLLGREILSSEDNIKEFARNNPDIWIVRIHGVNGIVQYLLSDIEEIETRLDPDKFFTYDHNTESSLMDEASRAARGINHVLSELLKWKLPFISKAAHYAQEILHDLEMMNDIFTRQNDILEKHIMVHPTKMIEQDPRSVDQISYEELHPDFQDFNIEDEEDERAKTE